MTNRPIIGLTADLAGDRYAVGRGYADLVEAAGGVAVILPCQGSKVDAHIELCDGFILTGGDDPDMAQWGQAMHPKARALHPERQAYETLLLAALDHHNSIPVLGVCLGMQLMGLHAGGALDQHLPDTLATAGEHWNRGEHLVSGSLGNGMVHSHHRQALTNAGALQVLARAHDGVIEAVADSRKRFHLGVQWHPERTREDALGRALIESLVKAARDPHHRLELASDDLELRDRPQPHAASERYEVQTRG